MMVIDFASGRIQGNDAIKDPVFKAAPYGKWLRKTAWCWMIFPERCPTIRQQRSTAIPRKDPATRRRIRKRFQG
jgi:hypothetical protein